MTIKLKDPTDTFSLGIAPLKYNKCFAFSFTLDDGLICDYLVAYPFFQGGTVAGAYIDQWGHDQGGDGKYYPGLTFTDGCGNSIPFRAGIAVNAKNIDGSDTISNHGYLTWQQIKSLLNSGWGILNHGYSHATGKNVAIGFEVKRNNTVVKKHTGIEMQGFVVPGGHDDKWSNKSYAQEAFDLGASTVQNEHNGNYIIDIDTIRNLKRLKLGRLFMHTTGDRLLWIRSGSNETIQGDGMKLFTTINDHLKQGTPFWINAFTHGVGNQNIWGISLKFSAFINFFNRMEAFYGQNGRDNIWMAPTQEVYDYLLNRKLVKFSFKKRAGKIKVFISRESLPRHIRYHELSFLLSDNSSIRSVRCRGCIIESYSSHSSHGLVNFKWK